MTTVGMRTLVLSSVWAAATATATATTSTSRSLQKSLPSDVFSGDLNFTGDPVWIDDVWLDAIVVLSLTSFVLCLMGLAKVSTAKMGMLYGIFGMSALIAVYWSSSWYTYGDGLWLVAVSMIPGAIIGVWSSYAVGMTMLPEMVGAYNGFGGLAAALEGFGLYLDPSATFLVRNGQDLVPQTSPMLWVQAIALLLSVIIGMVTFTGSMVACLKLHETISTKPHIIPYRWFTTVFMFVAMVVFGTFCFTGGQTWNDRGLGVAFLTIVAVVAGMYGVVFVLAIGGGDMPCVICFLNSLSGFSTSAAGFMLSNKALVVSGAFVGCSGIILTIVMCNAMNRSIANVLIGGFGDGGGSSGSAKVAKKAEGTVTQVSAEDVVDILTGSKSVIIVPGYGMAVAKAQHAVAALTTRLRRRGIKCRFAIHPVAGRMPGHMNVLLAEASVPYDLILSMDDINQDFSSTDSVLILGANDIVNPGAQTDPDSPIAGMPVLEVWKAKRTVTMKRSLATGYAGVDNPLFVNENNAMYLGDAKKSVERLVELLGDVDDAVAETAKKVDIETPAQKKAKAVDEFVALMPQMQKDAFLKVGVLRECSPNEAKVAVVPDGCQRLLKKGIQVYVEADAGMKADFYNDDYKSHGAIVLNTAQEVCNSADIIVKIREPTVNPSTNKHEIDMIGGSSKSLISFLGPRTDDGKALMAKAVDVGVNLLAVDAIPRISRAQSLDVLSSQAKIAGYRAVIQAASLYQKFLNAEVTAAGSFEATKILVIGAGVAGLAAIGTASNLGAIVRAFDTRLETKEQIESLGGEFLEIDFGDEQGGNASGYAKVMSEEFIKREMALFRQQLRECSIVITTAAIPGMRAPILVKEEAVLGMQPGSVIVDLAGATGGNCELTKPGETYVYKGVTIIGSDMTNQAMAWQASTMYSNNIVNLFDVLCKEKQLNMDMTDPIIRSMTCTWNGEIIFPPPESITKTSAGTSKATATLAPVVKGPPKESMFAKRVFDLAPLGEFVMIFFTLVFFGVVAAFAPITFTSQLGYFILAGFLGYYLIWNVEPALFSPLMSTSNALSGVVIVGGILMVSSPRGTAASVFGCVATTVGAINVYGGFAVSYRMLLMYKKETK